MESCYQLLEQLWYCLGGLYKINVLKQWLTRHELFVDWAVIIKNRLESNKI